jgi:AcrR family transcriptional regulator
MQTSRPASTRRGRERREQILASAARLVASQGFHTVGVSDIGAAAGVSGAALYRHFATKSEILVALLDRVVDRLLDGAAAASHGDDPGVVLATLIEVHVDFAISEKAILAVYAQEAHNLPAVDRTRLRRKQRHYVDMWTDAYRRRHPSSSEKAARAVVEGVFGMLNSVPNMSPDLSDQLVGRELRRLARTALLSDPDTIF